MESGAAIQLRLGSSFDRNRGELELEPIADVVEILDFGNESSSRSLPVRYL
jgi:hypothetical protein